MGQVVREPLQFTFRIVPDRIAGVLFPPRLVGVVPSRPEEIESRQINFLGIAAEYVEDRGKASGRNMTTEQMEFNQEGFHTRDVRIAEPPRRPFLINPTEIDAVHF